MVHQCHKIVLLLDNCPHHPDISLSNVKLVFLPKGTTSELQPLHHGIIAWLKRYTRLMMSNINLVIKESENVTDVAKCITIYDGIVNIIGSWELTPSTTIREVLSQLRYH